MRVVDNPLHAIDYAKEVQPDFFVEFQEFMKKFILMLKLPLGV